MGFLLFTKNKSFLTNKFVDQSRCVKVVDLDPMCSSVCCVYSSLLTVCLSISIRPPVRLSFRQSPNGCLSACPSVFDKDKLYKDKYFLNEISLYTFAYTRFWTEKLCQYCCDKARKQINTSLAAMV